MSITVRAQNTTNEDWPTYGGGLSAQHYSARTQINRSNVRDLVVAWTYHTGALRKPGHTNRRSNFEANPILWRGRLYLDTPYDEVFALDATTGTKVWSYDPEVSHDTEYGIIASRGVALWHSSRPGMGNCDNDRVFVATLDRRLIALDATSGVPCSDFGEAGAVDLAQSLHLADTQWYSFTSPPTVLGDVVVIGSSVADNQLVEAPSGVIRGFDARSGALMWSFEPLRAPLGSAHRSGSGGTWSVISADPQLGLFFAPTGSPSTDFYGANRPGDDRDGNSVVALDARTGHRVWAFQIVHHDLWDLDVAAEPLLFTFRGTTPAVAVTTKMGMTFVLDRRTGLPLYPVEERPVPPSDVPGEVASSTQPFSSLPLMSSMTIDPAEIRDLDAGDKRYCLNRLAGLVNHGVYTPVGLKPTLLYPGSVGGVNWGSAALDPQTGVLYANVNQLAYETRLVPRDPPPATVESTVEANVLQWLQDAQEYWREQLWPLPAGSAPQNAFQPPDSRGYEMSAQTGTPYKIYRAPLVTPGGLPCSPNPWSAVVALDLNGGKILWRTPLGTLVPGHHSGAVTVGGPIVTAGGLVFTGGGSEPLLHAFDAATGQELWEGTLPAAAQSTPMTYEMGGRQYVVIAAGGHMTLAPTLSDAVVAFALPVPTPLRGAQK
jgi:quinoprotein glucose dehydrogenase